MRKRARPGRQREYSEHILSPKRDDTRQRRIAKVLPMIVAGIGLNDRYRGQDLKSQALGLMFALSLKRLLGSYFFFNSSKRGKLAW